MGSLRDKAERYLETLDPDEKRKQLKLVRPEDAAVESDDDISPEEREKIDAQIEQAVSASRIKVTAETLRITPQRSSGALPLVVNLLALLVVAAGILIALYVFQRNEQSILTSPVVLETAEGMLLEAVKQESRQQLEGKDREIAGIRERLAGVDEEKERIRREASDLVASRERELQAELQRSLEAERRRLEAQGVSEEVVAQRLAEIEEQSGAELASQLDQFRRQAESERIEKERTVELLRAEYERSLSQAQGERTRLQEESTRRQAELEAGYQQKQLALEQDKARAMEELDSLRQQQQKEQMVMDQFLGFYRRASEEIQASRLASARSVLAEFRRYLDEPAVASLQGISRRRPVELFLIGSLEEAISTRESQAATVATVQSLTASANLIAAVATLVQQGDSLFGERDYEKARELYLSAMAKIPAVQTGYAKLQEIEGLFETRGKDRVAALLNEANAAYRAGDYAGAVRVYGQALEILQGERGAVDTLVAQLLDIGARTREGELQPRIRTLERELETRTQELAEARTALAASEAASAEARAALAASEAAAGETAAREETAREAAAREAAEREAVAREAAASETRAMESAELASRAAAEAAARNELIEALQGRLAARESEAQSLGVLVAEREETILTLSGEVAGLRRNLEGRASELEKLQAEVASRLGRADSVSALRERSSRAAQTENAAASRDSLLALLETKLLVQRLLLSEEVLAQYPDLYDGLERYLEALVAERQTEARLQTLQDLDTLLGSLLGVEADQGELVARYSAADQNALLLSILDKLKRLLA